MNRSEHDEIGAVPLARSKPVDSLGSNKRNLHLVWLRPGKKMGDSFLDPADHLSIRSACKEAQTPT